LDITVLCFPLPMVLKLQMSTGRKIAVLGVFWLGACCVISSIVRLVYVIQYTRVYSDPTAQISSIIMNIIIWSQIEPCISIVAACLPSLSPLLGSGKGGQKWISSIRSFISNHSLAHVSRRRTKSSVASSKDSSRSCPSRGWEKINSVNPTLRDELELRSAKLRDVEQQHVNNIAMENFPMA